MRQIAVVTVALAAAIAQADSGPAVTNPFPDEIGASDQRVMLHEVAAGLTMPLWATHANDGSNRLFVIDQIGKIYVIKDGKMLPTPALDLSSRIVEIKPNFDERGLLGIAFHPGFSKDGRGHDRVYTYTSEPIAADRKADFSLGAVEGLDHQSVITEWRMKPGSDTIDPATRRELLRFDQPQFNHDGGAIAFGHDGMLYIATGDGGNAHDKGPGHSPGGNGQDLTKVLGKILRIDPLGDNAPNKQYGVPKDNPFVGRDDAVDIIWAYGMRNPFRMSVDRKEGTIVVGDIGQNMIEEVDIITRGGNFGWPIKEGTFYFDQRDGKEGIIYKSPLTDAKLPTMIDPAVQYDHDDGISVIGGFVYRGKAFAKLQGLYVFGEWTRKSGKSLGRLMHADLKTGRTHEMLLPSGDPVGHYVTGMGEDGDGELYLLISDSVGPKGTTGKVFKINPAK